MQSSWTVVQDSLAPLKMVMSARGRCEATVHATFHLMLPLPCPSEQHWTDLVLSLAFTNINWEAMFMEFCQHLPGSLAWMESFFTHVTPSSISVWIPFVAAPVSSRKICCICTDSPSYCRMHQGQGTWSWFECLLPWWKHPGGLPRGSCSCAEHDRVGWPHCWSPHQQRQV